MSENIQDLLKKTEALNEDVKKSTLLIAAAPELLAAVRQALKVIRNIEDEIGKLTPEETACIEQLKAAISKAEGKVP
jgi:hypothetical protein